MVLKALLMCQSVTSALRWIRSEALRISKEKLISKATSMEFESFSIINVEFRTS